MRLGTIWGERGAGADDEHLGWRALSGDRLARRRARSAARRISVFLLVSVAMVASVLLWNPGAGASTPKPTTWTQLSPATSPSVRGGSSMAYDPATREIMLFGGATSGGAAANDTWEWNGSVWTQLSPAKSPPARAGAPMAYDQATGQLLLFGGAASPDSYLKDTWDWTGTTWSQLTLKSNPTAAFQASMAYDSSTGQLLLVKDDCTTITTWSWSGAAWTHLHPTTSPPVRCGTSIAYDSTTSQLVLVGGQKAANYLNDTWVWSGTTWTHLHPAASPADLGTHRWPRTRSRASWCFPPVTTVRPR